MPDLDLSRRIVYRIDGMQDAVVRRGLIYKRDGASELRMDVYSPSTRPRERMPAVFFVHGGPIPSQMLAPTEWGVFVSYGELAAASGLVGITFNHRLYAPADYPLAVSDMKDAIAYVRSHADDLGVDADRLAVWVFSGGGPLGAWLLRERPPYVRCLLAFYPYLTRHDGGALPMLIARAGLDVPMINDSIDQFVRDALASNAPLDLLNHPRGQHGFDILDDDPRSHDIIARAVAFAQAHL